MRAREGGIVLVQVMIMALLIGLISTYLIEWALQRYQLVARHQQFVDSASRAQGCIGDVIQSNYTALVQQGALPPLNQPAVPCYGDQNNWGTYVFSASQRSGAPANSPRTVTLTRNILLP